MTANVTQDSVGSYSLSQNSISHPVKAVPYRALQVAWFDGTGTDLGSNNQASPPNGDYPYMYRPATLLGANDGTVAFWMKRTGRSVAQPFGGLFWERGTGWGHLLVEWNEGSDSIHTLYGVGDVNSIYTYGVQSTNWTHIAVTRSGSTIRVYRNGALAGAGFAGVAGSASATVVGGTRAGHGYFVGYFYDYNVWVNTVLDSSQVQSLYLQSAAALQGAPLPGLLLRVM